MTGWRPARTMKFCSWGGEEAGLIGSSEYVEVIRINLLELNLTNLDSLKLCQIVLYSLSLQLYSALLCFEQQHIKILRERTVVYVNIDTAVYGK